MPLYKRVNENFGNEWRPIPVGVYRFHINTTPEVKFYEQWNDYRVKFPLALTPDEQKRVFEEYGKPPEGEQQSTLTSYMTGLSLGWMDKQNKYHTTKLTDFLAPCLGQANMKRFHEWLQQGGGPPRAADPENPDQEIEMYRQWFGWWEGLEILGSIRHEEQNGTIWARFGGPLAVGSLPGQKEEAYQAMGLGKLRSMIAEYEASLGKKPAQQPVAAGAPSSPAGKRSYNDVFPEDAREDPKELPF